jgi:AbiEi antitoxin C-terminal domain
MSRLPTYVTQRPFRTFRPADLADHISNPSVQVARWVDQGRVHRLAPGYAMAIPDDRDRSWRPSLETAAAGVGSAIFGVRNVALMGLSAARVHQALPRAVSVAVVAVPRQHRPVRLRESAQILFVKRDVDALDVRLELLELGRALVTTPEQTVVDLAARPDLGGAPDEARQAALALLGQCDDALLRDLARAQRARAPLERLVRSR